MSRIRRRTQSWRCAYAAWFTRWVPLPASLKEVHRVPGHGVSQPTKLEAYKGSQIGKMSSTIPYQLVADKRSSVES
jgi:hypothetical protein